MLLERDEELARFSTALAELRSGRGGVLGVSAPVGAGRSALLDAFGAACAPTPDAGGADAPPVRVVRATAVPGERGFDGALLDALLDDLDDLDDPDGADDLDVPGDDALRDAVLAVGAPVVVLVDDVHHADTASLRGLRVLASAVDRAPVLLVLSTASREPGAADEELRALWSHAVAPLVLAALGPDAVGKLVRSVLPPGTADEQCAIEAATCRERTGGRALFVVAESAGLARHGVGDGAAVSARAWLADRLRATVESLPGPERRALSGVVVLRGAVDLELLAELLDDDEADCGLAVEALSTVGLLVDRGPGGAVAPVHPAVTMVVEDLLGVDGRTDWHTRAAEVLHRRGAPARAVAEQLVTAGAPAQGWAVAVLREAAADTWFDEGPAAAARTLRVALLRAAPADADRGPLLLDLVEVEREFDPPAALLHVLQAVDLTVDPLDRAAAFSRLAPASLVASPLPLETGLRELADELEGLAAREPRGATPGPAAAATARVRAREWYLALERPERLRSVADRLGAGDGDPRLATAAGREQLAVVLHAAVLAGHVDAGEAARRARDVLDREPPGPDHVHSGVALTLSALVAADRLEDLSSWLAEAAEAAEAQGCPVVRCVVAGEQAVVAVAEGRLGGAREHLRTVAALFDRRWNDDGPMVALPLLPIAAALDDAVLSTGLLSRLRRRETSPYAAAGVAYAGGWEAERRGDPRRAADHFRTAGAHLEQSGWVNPAVLPWRTDLARVLHQAGETRTALDVLAEEHVRAEEWGAPALLGRVHRLRGEILGGRGGRTMLSDAVTVLAASGNRREAALASLALGRDLRKDRDPAARRHLAHALALAESCEDPDLVAAVTATAAASPAAVARRTAADVRDPGAALTVSEHRVAVLAVDGRTNGEIAATLGISVRGVEKHLTRCYRKTGARGRADLGGRLASRAEG